MLAMKYEHTHDLEDLQQAILKAEEAEEAAVAQTAHRPQRAACLCNIGSLLVRRYERTKKIEDLQQAIAKTRKAVAAVPANDGPHRAVYLSNLATFLQLRYKRTGMIEDSQQAIARAEEAGAATPVDNPDRWRYLAKLERLLSTRYSGVQQRSSICIQDTVSKTSRSKCQTCLLICTQHNQSDTRNVGIPNPRPIPSAILSEVL
jgi:tetratricopeptide (TPR) repeat protein